MAYCLESVHCLLDRRISWDCQYFSCWYCLCGPIRYFKAFILFYFIFILLLKQMNACNYTGTLQKRSNVRVSEAHKLYRILWNLAIKQVRVCRAMAYHTRALIRKRGDIKYATLQSRGNFTDLLYPISNIKLLEYNVDFGSNGICISNFKLWVKLISGLPVLS